jgi:hypothetical protein
LDYTFGSTRPRCGATCTYDQHLSLGSRFAPEGDDYDISPYRGFKMHMKASKAGMVVRVQVGTRDVADKGYYLTEFALTAEWKEYALTFNDVLNFRQPPWADPVDFNPARVHSLLWELSAANSATPDSGVLYIDNIRVWK